ncbi:MAG: hypothetical protein AAF127_02395 [Pseudomonadota bacterium]
MRSILALLLLATSTVPASAAPPPPLAPAEKAFYDEFFSALPQRFPEQKLDRLRKIVAADVEVFFEGDQRFDTREEWLGWLNAMAVENRVERTSMSREAYFIQSGGRILVHEFWFPYRQNTVFHPEFPHKLVSYKFKDSKLVRVDYLADVRPTRHKFGASDDG